MFQFDFLEGGPFGEDDVRDRRKVAVISRTTADKYFGTASGVVGKTIEVGEQRYQVVGVVRDVSSLRKFGFADIWTPITTEQGAAPRPEWLGGGSAVVLLTSPAAIPAAKQAFQERLGRWQSPDPRQFRRMQAAFDTRFENTARDIFGDDVDTVDHSGKLWALLGGGGRLLPAAADGEPDELERQPHPGTGLGDRRAQVVRGHRRARWWGSSWSRTWC